MTQTLPVRSRSAGPVLAGLGGMLGAGVFTGLAPAAAMAGGWFLVAVVLAALVAACGAFSVAFRSRAAPELGGYQHMREQLGRWPTRMSASAHLLGRAAALAALAGTLGAYLAPHQRVAVAAGLVVLATALDACGFRLGTPVSWVLTAGVLLVLGIVVAVCFGVPPPPRVAGPVPYGLPGADDPTGIAGAAAVMFFAFLGFDRIAGGTADERRSARWPVRFVVPALLGVALLAYLAVGFAAYHQLGPARLALSPAPLADTLLAADAAPLLPVLDIGVVISTVPVLLLVLAGTRRMVAAMAEAGDLPGGLARPGRTGVPWPASVLGGAGGLVAVALLPPAAAVSLAACGALFHHAFTNAAARLVLLDDATAPARLACLGLVLSVVLAMSLPVPDLLVTAAAVAAGTGVCAIVSRRRR